MKRLILTASFLVFGMTAIFAQKYMTRTGKIFFNATALHSPERIEGVNNEVASIIDTKSGEVAFQVLIKSYKFSRALMQEHFNEDYMESDKFPKSEFKGNITNMGEVNLAKDGTYKATVTGKLTIHGVTNEVIVPGTITVIGNKIKLKAKFTVKLADYNITVPAMVDDKVSKEATIDMESDLDRK